MSAARTSPSLHNKSSNTGYYALLALIVLGGAGMRAVGLGERSLWADEFCTWYVSRIPFVKSLAWGPELSKPPLYQVALRVLTDHPRPEEWLLRLPAAIAGVLTILAVYALARRAAGLVAGCAAAGLVAFNLLQITYGQEARPYTFFVLGATVSTLLWWRLVLKPSVLFALTYAVAVILTFHSHYLSLLVFAAHASWWCLVSWRKRSWRNLTAPGALGIAGVFCVPVVVNYTRHSASTFQGLDWIAPTTVATAVSVLNQLTFGPVWTVALVAALAWWALSLTKQRVCSVADDRTDRTPGTCEDIVGLLLFWLVFSWFGLLVLSWIAHPAMVVRYALPAAIPALIIPVVVVGRFERRLPLAVMLIFCALGVYRWQDEHLVSTPGFRELSAYLAETVDPDRDLVVLAIETQAQLDWIDAERLPFDYYPVAGAEIGELILGQNAGGDATVALDDPRVLYVVVFRTDPFPVLKAHGRRTIPFTVKGKQYSQLLFSPYRLIRVAAAESSSER